MKKRGKQYKSTDKKIIPQDIKICPFQSNGEEEVACSPRCMLFRANKRKGYECPFSEMTSISWLLRESGQKNFNYKNNNQYYGGR